MKMNILARLETKKKNKNEKDLQQTALFFCAFLGKIKIKALI